jgi:hypothetical protein
VTLYNRYIVSLALIFSLTSVVFALVAIANLDLCLTIYIIESLIVTELFIYLNPRAKRNLIWVNVILFSLFILLVVAKIAEIILGQGLLF